MRLILIFIHSLLLRLASRWKRWLNWSAATRTGTSSSSGILARLRGPRSRWRRPKDKEPCSRRVSIDSRRFWMRETRTSSISKKRNGNSRSKNRRHKALLTRSRGSMNSARRRLCFTSRSWHPLRLDSETRWGRSKQPRGLCFPNWRANSSRFKMSSTTCRRRN